MVMSEVTGMTLWLHLDVLTGFYGKIHPVVDYCSLFN